MYRVYKVWKDGKPYIGMTSQSISDRRADGWPQDPDLIEVVLRVESKEEAAAKEKAMILEVWPNCWNKEVPGVKSQKFREVHSRRMVEAWETGVLASKYSKD